MIKATVDDDDLGIYPSVWHCINRVGLKSAYHRHLTDLIYTICKLLLVYIIHTTRLSNIFLSIYRVFYQMYTAASKVVRS